MRIIRTTKKILEFSATCKKNSFKIGLVPTMGSLHEGHISLIKTLSNKVDKKVVSIFVNKKQFGENEDFDIYPREEKEDLKKLDSLTDIVFIPEQNEIYPINFDTVVKVNKLSKVMCGKSRPTHFQGVTTVVARLFRIVKPDLAVFGQKDIQQAIIIKRMVEDLLFNIEIIIHPIIREKDGLAKSSRNKYLKTEERERALNIYKALRKSHEKISNGESNSQNIKDFIIKILKKSNIEIDYVEIVNQKLQQVKTIKQDTIIAIAVFIGKTRLIDNIII